MATSKSFNEKSDEDLEKLDDEKINQLAMESWNAEEQQSQFKLSKLEQYFRKIFNMDNSSAKEFNAIWLTDDQYKSKANEALHEAWIVLNSPGWKLESKEDQPYVEIESKVHWKYGKVYKSTAVVNASADFMLDIVHWKFEDVPKWNPSMLEGQIIKKIDSTTDIVYQVTAGGGKGMVAPRDFIVLRKLGKIDSSGVPINDDSSNADGPPMAYVSAGVSVEIPGWAPTKKYVRGENLVGCWAIMPTKTTSGEVDPNKIMFQWLMGVNLKGRIPQFVIDVALSTAMTQYIGHLRAYVAKSKT